MHIHSLFLGFLSHLGGHRALNGAPCAVRVAESTRALPTAQQADGSERLVWRQGRNLNCRAGGSRRWQVQAAQPCLTLCDRPHGLQHARLLCPSPTPGVYSNSCPWSWCCHPAISPSVVPFSSRLQSFPASGSFPVSRLFASGGQDLVGHICCSPGLKLPQVALACSSLLIWTGDMGPSGPGLGCHTCTPWGSGFSLRPDDCHSRPLLRGCPLPCSLGVSPRSPGHGSPRQEAPSGCQDSFIGVWK